MKAVLSSFAVFVAIAAAGLAPAQAQLVQPGRCTPGKFSFSSTARCTWALVISGKDGASLAVVSDSFLSEEPCDRAGKDLLLRLSVKYACTEVFKGE